MASAAEQLASNMSLGVFSKATELKQRLWFTLAALIVTASAHTSPYRVSIRRSWPR